VPVRGPSHAMPDSSHDIVASSPSVTQTLTDLMALGGLREGVFLPLDGSSGGGAGGSCELATSTHHSPLHPSATAVAASGGAGPASDAGGGPFARVSAPAVLWAQPHSSGGGWHGGLAASPFAAAAGGWALPRQPSPLSLGGVSGGGGGMEEGAAAGGALLPHANLARLRAAEGAAGRGEPVSPQVRGCQQGVTQQRWEAEVVSNTKVSSSGL
jgi:hypothetical protein